MTAPEVWTVGHLTVDDLVLPEGTTRMGTVGGAALYAALGARYAGARSTVVSRLGAGFPAAALDGLAAAGVGTALVEVGRPAIQQWALYERDGSRQYVPHPGSGTIDDLSPDPTAYRVPAGATVHVAPMPLVHQDRWCRALAGRTLTLDPHHDMCAEDPAAVLDLLPRLTAFLPSHLEIQRLGLPDPVDAVRRFRARGVPVAAVKLGGDGCVVAAGDSVWHVPALPVSVQDPTGAGDAFCGGFAAALARGDDAVTAARWATAAASIIVERVGTGLGSGPLPFDEMPDRMAAVTPSRLSGPDRTTVPVDTRRNETV